MITVFAGSRWFFEDHISFRILDSHKDTISEIITGLARGPDTHGMHWAVKNGLPIRKFKPDWDGLGKRAGMVRNADMVNVAEQVIVIWDGESAGTLNTIKLAKKRELTGYVYLYKEFEAPNGKFRSQYLVDWAHLEDFSEELWL